MQIVGCQTDIVWENKAANHDRVRGLLLSSPIKPGALVVLPEMFATGFSMHVDTIAEPAGGETQTFLAEVARQFRSYLLGGVVTRAADGRGRNEAVVYGPDGQQVARYCKLHPFSYAGETKYYQAGETNVLFACHDFQVAPFVCYDLRFPEIFRRAVRRGAQLLVVIANWPQARESHWLALLRARAIENQAYVVGVNRAGSDPHARYGGHSLFVGPRGETLAEGGEGPELVTAEIELAPLLEYRRQFPALADMRAEFFAE
ncbi:MAG: carbon-nitrogen family hydrolase [Planctomycetia bacterium]|nr:carbon-nitrogen family hydrolase [Planctomycetia bacterium]